MKAAIYARVSTERQAERGTIGSQVEALRGHVAAAGDELAGQRLPESRRQVDQVDLTASHSERAGQAA